MPMAGCNGNQLDGHFVLKHESNTKQNSEAFNDGSAYKYNDLPMV